MRTRVLSLFVLWTGLTLGALPATAVTIDWVPIGDPGNASEACFVRLGGVLGSGLLAGECAAVDYEYSISKYEVTNAQYAEFLNAKAASDPFLLYSTEMASSPHGGIVREGSAGSYTYTVKPGFADKPVNFVTYHDAFRFANWLHNGQGSGDTETGAYTLLDGSATYASRNPDAKIVLPNVDEWYKAAYYDALSASYLLSAAGADSLLTCTAPGATSNTGNCFGSSSTEPSPDRPNTVTDVGAYSGSPSPYGAFDQEGNVTEWLEDGGPFHVSAGGSFETDAPELRHMRVLPPPPRTVGFRVALVPEPGTIALVMMGPAGLSLKRKGV